MAGALRELLAVFTTTADVGPLRQADAQINQTKANANQLSQTLKTIGAALLAGFSVNALGGFLKGQADLGSQINDTATRLGVGTDELQKFQYASKLEGVGAEEAAHSLSLLNRTIGEAITGSAEAAKKFSGVGIALKDADGKTRPALDVLGDVADKFQGMDDPTRKAALAMDLFGRSGQALIPVLNKGRQGLADTYKEAEDLGAILGKDFIEEADKAGDQIDRFGFALEGVKAKLALYVLPTLTSMVTVATNMAKALSDLASNTTLLDTGLIALGLTLGVVAVALGIVDLEFLALVAGAALAALVVLGLYLVFDDLYNLFLGNESVTGDILDFFIGVGARKKEVQDLQNAVNELGDALANMGITTDGVGSILVEMAANAIRSFLGVLRIIEAVAGSITAIANIASGKVSITDVLSGKVDPRDVGGLGTVKSALTRPPPVVYDQGVEATFSSPDLKARVAEQKIANTFNVNVNANGKDGKTIGRDIVDGAVGRTTDSDYKSALAAVGP